MLFSTFPLKKNTELQVLVPSEPEARFFSVKIGRAEATRYVVLPLKIFRSRMAKNFFNGKSGINYNFSLIEFFL